MADSNITKKALAEALKELMQKMPFEKINVAQICEKCDMNRKSFYYHFKDKYDLVNWIFDTEFITIATQIHTNRDFEERVLLATNICSYLYENRSFYRKALQIKGQNSFSDHFREYLQPVLKERLIYLSLDEAMALEIDEFTIDFLTDAVMCALERWLLDKNCMPAEEFVERFMNLIEMGANIVQHEFDKRNQK